MFQPHSFLKAKRQRNIHIISVTEAHRWQRSRRKQERFASQEAEEEKKEVIRKEAIQGMGRRDSKQ